MLWANLCVMSKGNLILLLAYLMSTQIFKYKRQLFFPSGSGPTHKNTLFCSLMQRTAPNEDRLNMMCILLIAFVSCLRFAGGTEVRLIGGKHEFEGRVEVKYDDEWRAVCDHGWNKKAANVVCRMLGYPDALRFTKG